jgi:hypothetical protein
MGDVLELLEIGVRRALTRRICRVFEGYAYRSCATISSAFSVRFEGTAGFSVGANLFCARKRLISPQFVAPYVKSNKNAALEFTVV